MPTLSSQVRIPEDVHFCVVGSEAVILHLSSGNYYGLDEVGTRVWQSLARHGVLEPVVTELLEEYEVDRQRLCEDVLGLVGELEARRLLRVSEVAASPGGRQPSD